MKEDKPYPKMTEEEWRKRREREDRKEWFIEGSVALVSVMFGIFVIHKAIEQGIPPLTMFLSILLCIAFTLFLSRYVLVNMDVIKK